MSNPMTDRVFTPTLDLLNYCRERDWAGFDPYDALNSRIFAATPFNRSRTCRIAITQLLKRLPVDIRPLLGIPRQQNPKSMGLFLQALLTLSRAGVTGGGDGRARIGGMIDRIAELRSEHPRHFCWGYSFPWQGRSLLVPRWAPNLVCTTFVANALVDAYESLHDPRCLEMAASASRYLTEDLYWEENGVSSFCYPSPASRVQVHNANFLGAALLGRVHAHTGDPDLAEVALRVTRFSASRQHDDGSWDYGALATQKWVDNFHTGFNLCALRTIAGALGTDEFDPALRLGFTYYRESFFLPDFAPKYYDRRAYPIDAHAIAQSIITLLAFESGDRTAEEAAFGVFDWAMKNMWSRSGYFYYRKYRVFRNRISYMRWTQAWMLLALATLLEYVGGDQTRRAGAGTTRETSEVAL